jgi:hypothetical protein
LRLGSNTALAVRFSKFWGCILVVMTAFDRRRLLCKHCTASSGRWVYPDNLDNLDKLPLGAASRRKRQLNPW